MKIQSVKIFVVANPPPHYGGPYFVFLKLITDGGVEGLGEAYCLPFGPHTVARMIEDVVERFVIGQDPFQIERLWRIIYSSGYTQRPDLSLMAVLSAIEMACWDIIGKELNRPIYDLLGGRVHEKLRAYTYIYPHPDDPGNPDIYTNPDLVAERAADYVRQGFTAVKADPAAPYTAFDPRQLSLTVLERSERYVANIREAVGSRCDILFGTHGQMTPAGAIRLAKRLEAYDPLWYEEPTPPENPVEMAKVARATSIPIATGERLATKYEYQRVLRHGAAAILQPNLARCGGILEGKKIAGIAEAHYAQIAPHLYNGPVAGAANIQLATCSPNFLILEGIEQWGGFHADILKRKIEWQDGYVIPPAAPGLGIELNEAVALAHPHTGSARHLNPAESPEY